MDPYSTSMHMGFHTVSTSNPQPISTQACARRTAQWMPEDNRVFITACEIIIVDKHRSGKCFTKHGWHKIVQLFNANSGHDWSRYQLKNHWDYLRVKYKHLENLTDSIDIAHDSARCSLVASDKWWARKIKENKEYREFKDKDCRETYAYQLLFVDAFDSEKYATTLTKLCRIGFAMFEDSANVDTRDTMPMYDESSGSSDEGNKLEGSTSSMDFSNRRSGENCRSGSSKSKEKRTKISAKELSYSIDRATIVSEKVTTKIDNLVGSNVPSMKTCMKELFAMGRMQKKTDLYF